MKYFVRVGMLLLLGYASLAAPADTQPGTTGLGSLHALAPGTPSFPRNFGKLFGEHNAFTALMNSEVNRAGNSFTSTAKVFFLAGKTRMEVDVSKSKGASLPRGSVEHLGRMGLSQLVVITLPEANKTVLIYPSLQAYAEFPSSETTNEVGKIDVEISRVSEEQLAGHPCVKNRITMKAADGRTEEALVWNATDLAKFPLRIETADQTATATVTFSEVKFEKPDAQLFAPPANFVKYESVQKLIRESVMARMRGGRALPDPQ